MDSDKALMVYERGKRCHRVRPLLEATGYDVCECRTSDPAVAIERLNEFKPRVVVIDPEVNMRHPIRKLVEYILEHPLCLQTSVGYYDGNLMRLLA